MPYTSPDPWLSTVQLHGAIDIVSFLIVEIVRTIANCEFSVDLRTPRQPRPSSHKLRYVSTAAVRAKFPGSGHMEVYTSKGKAIADLYEKRSRLADYALWDPVTRIFEAYPIGQEIFPALSGEGLDKTQYVWLPINR